ncbi:ABC transporter permease [Bacillus wiedmannii]|uniref:ABC transporter permease n=1 Tax=Bacillus wiedmannii TaxID=1890302 RepID=A0A4U2MWB2_9BACI|nr:ABC transporter permease [Bacillus wiedmannii]TKH15614.1 ABC transporter permease [Bacillus wiedmannii]
MNKFRILTGHIFLQKLKNKMFIISTILLLLAITVAIAWPKLEGIFQDKDPKTKIYVVDQTNQNVMNTLSNSKIINYIETAKNIKNLEKEVKEGKVDGVLDLKEKNDMQILAELKTYDSLSAKEIQLIEQDIASVNQLLIIQQSKLTPEQAKNIFNAKVSIKEINLNKESKSDEEKQAGAYVSYAVGFLIYIFIISYLSMITNDVASEKSSRIMEILISSVSPSIHLLSKIFGVLAAGVTQIFILIIYSLGLLYLFGGDYLERVNDIKEIVSVSYFIFTIIFIILAYILYLAIGATLGSLVSKVEETSQAILPPVMLVMVGFFVMFYGMIDPNSMVVKVFSYIPFTSPMVMPMRISTTDMQLWQPALSVLILILTIVTTLAFNLRLYQGSVLIYSSNSVMKKIKQAWSLTK